MFRIGGVEIRINPGNNGWGVQGSLEVRTVEKGKYDWNEFGGVSSWEYFLENKFAEFSRFRLPGEDVIEYSLRKSFSNGKYCEILAEIPRLMLTFDESQVEVVDDA